MRHGLKGGVSYTACVQQVDKLRRKSILGQGQFSPFYVLDLSHLSQCHTGSWDRSWWWLQLGKIVLAQVVSSIEKNTYIYPVG